MVKNKGLIIFRSAALGDFILAAPALNKVREIYPEHRVILLTTQSASRDQRAKVAAYAGNTDRMPWVELARPHLIDEVVVLDNLTSITALWQVRQVLKQYRVERVILMLDPCAPWLGRLKKLLMMYFLVGWVPMLGWRGRGSLNGDRARLKQAGLLRHHVHGPLQFMAELKPPRSYSDDELVSGLEPGNAAKQWAKNWLGAQGIKGEKLLGVAPGAIQPHKSWPLDNYVELISRLLDEYPALSVVVIGTPADAELALRLVAIDPLRVKNLAGISSIAQSAAVLQHCALLVGNDGGAMHLGDAMGCKVISLVPGLEYPDSIEPWHNKKLAIRHEVSCAPCYSFTSCPAGTNQCMREMPIEKVLDRAGRLLMNEFRG